MNKYDFNTDNIETPWEKKKKEQTELKKKLEQDYQERHKKIQEIKKAEDKLAEKKVSKSEENILQQQSDTIKKFYLLDYWMTAFNKASFYNEIAGQALFHVALGQALRDLKIKLDDDSELDWRLHFLWIQDSGCLDKNTLIQTDKGNLKLKDLPSIFNVISYNFLKNKFENKIAKKINSGKKECFELELEDGRKVIVSEDHKFFINKKGKEKMVKNLKIGDKILCQNLETKDFLNKKNINKNMNLCKCGCSKIVKEGKKFIHGHYYNGKKLSKKTKNKLSELAKARWKNKEWVKKEMNKRQELVKNGNYKKRQLNNPRKGKTFEEQYGCEKAQILKEKISKNLKKRQVNGSWNKGKKCPQISKALCNNPKICGKNNPSYGIPRYPNRIFIKELNLKVKSSYEKEIALFLHKQKINFKYEGTAFELSNGHTYTPDFELEKNKFYLETKGPVYDSTIEKMNQFKKDYPNIKLIILYKNEKKGTKNLFKKINFESKTIEEFKNEFSKN